MRKLLSPLVGILPFTMKSELSEQQVANYRDCGFLVVEGFLDAEELADWRAQVAEAVEERLKRKPDPKVGEPWLTNTADGVSEYYRKVFLQCLKLADTHAGVRRLMLDPRIGEMAARLAGVDGIRIWHDQALIKPPFGNPTGWHLDNPYWSFSSRDAISLWVALDDATLGNGCMWYVPGTHKTARFENSGIGEQLDALFDVYPEWRAIEPVACACPAGSAVFHNGLVAHGAGANMTNKPRRAMTCAYMPDGSTYNGCTNVLPPEYYKTLKVGDVLNDDVINPLIWRA